MSAVDESQRANAAYNAILRRAEAGGKDWRKYRSMVLKLPVMVHREGLPVALHFVAARSDGAQKAVLDDLARDLGKGDRAGLLAWARGLSPAEIRDETRELQRRLAWYKRIAQAFGTDGNTPVPEGTR